MVQKTDAGLDVKVSKSEAKIFIPKLHISDHMSLCDLLLQTYTEGQAIKQAVYLSAKGNVIVSFSHHSSPVTLHLLAKGTEKAKESWHEERSFI